MKCFPIPLFKLGPQFQQLFHTVFLSLSPSCSKLFFQTIVMEQSCSKQTVPVRPSPLPTSLSRYQYAQYSQSSAPVIRPVQQRPVPAVLNNSDGSTYRRNDPANRTYRMRKRPPAQVYHCVQCNKHIKYPSKISEHIRKHTGEKPHICHLCGHCFSQAHTLKTHLQQHEREKPYKCSYCTAAFLNLCDKTEHETVKLFTEFKTLKFYSSNTFITRTTLLDLSTTTVPHFFKSEVLRKSLSNIPSQFYTRALSPADSRIQ